MNWLAILAGALTLVAFLAHAVGGGLELRHIAPADSSAKASEVRLQTINGWHWVSADLLLAAIAFGAVGVLRPASESLVLLGLSGYFLIVGVVWLVTTAVTTRGRPAMLLRLGQWILCFLLSALAWLAR